jgi:hypothetical protein
MTKNEILGKELSNLYAIAKQVNNYFDGSDISFLSERTKVILGNYVKFSCANEEETSETLKALQVNPGNTTDSIVNEITDNLHEVVLANYSKPLKELNYQLSLNRLLSYHMANVDNILHLNALLDKN